MSREQAPRGDVSPMWNGDSMAWIGVDVERVQPREQVNAAAASASPKTAAQPRGQVRPRRRARAAEE